MLAALSGLCLDAHLAHSGIASPSLKRALDEKKVTAYLPFGSDYDNLLYADR